MNFRLEMYANILTLKGFLFTFPLTFLKKKGKYSIRKQFAMETSLQKPATDLTNKPVIIFDGVCNFCNSWVNFVIDHDPKAYFSFAPNQTNAAKEILNAHGIDANSVETVYFWINGKLYHKSTAALQVGTKMGFPYSLSAILLIIPKFFRDFCYDIIARNRYNWFGKSDSCRMPTADLEARFLN